LDPTRVPSISASLLAPDGGYAAAALFGAQGGYAGMSGSLLDLGPLAPLPSVAAGLLSVLLLLAIAGGVLSLGPTLLRRP
jgi:hypothetical protein